MYRKKQFFKFIIALLSIITLLASCKKENEAVVPTVKKCQLLSLKKHSHGNYGYEDSSTYEYDLAGRLVRIQLYNTQGDSLIFETYEYGIDNFLKISYKTDKTIDSKQEYFLNTNGTVLKSVYTNDNPLANMLGDTLYYTYDNEGYNTMIVGRKYYGGAAGYTLIDTTWNTFSNGDNTRSLKKAYYSNSANAEVYENIITYSTEEKSNDFFYEEMPMQNLYGKGNKHLIANIIDLDKRFSETYTYISAADGLITGMEKVYIDNNRSGNNSTVNYTYTYDCE